MNHTAHPIAFLALIALLPLGSCGSGVDAAATDDADAAQPAAASGSEDAAPEPERAVANLLQRANERLLLMENDDWIQVYDYVAPSQRKQLDIGRFISNGQDNEYVLLEEPRFIGADEDSGSAYVQVLVEWTPTHAEIRQASNVGQGDLIQELDMIETWNWQEGDWYHYKSQRESDFRAEHPSLFERSDESAKLVEDASEKR